MFLKFIKEANRLELLKIAIGIVFTIQILISYPLWLTTEREFPLVPLIGNSTMGSSDFFHWLLFLMVLGGAISSFVWYKQKWTGYFFVGILLVAMLLDITRLQAWSYQYLLMLIVLMLFSNSVIQKRKESILKEAPSKSKSKKKANTKPAATKLIYVKETVETTSHPLYPYFMLSLQLILIFTYLWSGIQKLNIYFANDVFKWLMTSFTFLEPLGNYSVLGYLVAVVEILLGVGLIFFKSRQITIWATTSFHLIIIILLVKLDWNHVVWAWNVGMIGFNWILFSNKAIFKTSSNHSFKSLRHIFQTNIRTIAAFKLVMVLFGILPVLNFFGKLDDQLALKMYAGAVSEASFYFNDEDLTCLATSQLDQAREGLYPEETRIDMDDWAFRELTVPAYGGDWAYKRAGYEFCKCAEEKGLAGIEIFKVNRWDKETEEIIFPCNKLIRWFEK
jgi:hypothetical protein